MSNSQRVAYPTGLLILFFAASLPGCISLAPSEKSPELVAAIPSDYGDEPGISDDRTVQPAPYAPLEWWIVFGDASLNQLVDSALVANLDLVAAVGRVEEARAQLRATRGARFPAVTASGDVSVQDTPLNTGAFSIFGGGGGTDSTGGASSVARANTTTYSASLGFSYEFDFWGRVRNDTRAALNDAMSVAADLETARLGVIAETIANYFEIVDLRQRIALAVETLDVLSERVALTEERYDRGLASSFELYQIRLDYRNTQASLPDLESQLTDADARLAVLLGAYPGQLDAFLASEFAPSMSFEPIPVGLPADLLVQRPDVRAAALRFDAARYRVGARRAELFPTISLTGSIGTQSGDVGDLFNTVDQWAMNLVAGLTAPLFQGGRLRASVDAAQAQYKQLGAAYAKTVLTAYKEAYVALNQYDEQQQRYEFFLAQVDEAQASADLQASRFEAGISGYADYLDALRALQQVNTSLSVAGRQLALARLAVHRALGGGWTDGGRGPQFDLVQASSTNPPGQLDRS